MKKNFFSKNLFKEIKKIIKLDQVSLHEPIIENDDLISIKKCLISGYVSYKSNLVDNFEKSYVNILSQNMQLLPHLEPVRYI